MNVPYIKCMLKSIVALVLVRLMEVAHLSEGSLKEDPLYVCFVVL